jgi:hypothetical protein
MVERVWDSETGEVLRAGMSVAEIEGTEPGEKVEVKALVITDKWTEENEGYLAITPEKQEQLARMWWAVAALNEFDPPWRTLEKEYYSRYTGTPSHLTDQQKNELLVWLAQELTHKYLEAQKEGKIERVRTHGRLGDPTKLVIFLEHNEELTDRELNQGAARRAMDYLSSDNSQLIIRVKTRTFGDAIEYGRLYSGQGWLYAGLINAVNNGTLSGIDVGRSLLEHKANIHYAILAFSGYDYNELPYFWAWIGGNAEEKNAFMRLLGGDWLGGDFVKNK